MDYKIVDRILSEFPLIWNSIQSLPIGLIVAKLDFWIATEVEKVISRFRMKGFDGSLSISGKLRHKWLMAGKPDFSKPNRWHGDQFGLFRPSVVNGSDGDNIFSLVFGIFNEDIEVSVFIENTCVDQFKLGL